MSSSAPAGQPRRNNTPNRRNNPHLFTRDPDGWVRVRLRLDPGLASLIEEGAGDTPLMIYIHRALANRAKYHIRKRQEESERLGISPDNIYDLIDGKGDDDDDGDDDGDDEQAESSN